MPKAKTILVLDTETADLTGSVYDVGYTITNKKGEILAEFNALVEEVFTQPKRMMKAFYAKKLFSHYAPMLDRSEISIMPWSEIVAQMQSDMLEHGVTVLAAYNLGFDLRVMKSTNKEFGTGAVCPAGMELLDIWQFACETKLNSTLYKRLAKRMGWVSKAGNINTGAEYAYRFCAGDWGFIEDHTALSDAKIETDIMAACFAAKKRVPYGVMNAQPWRIVNA